MRPHIRPHAPPHRPSDTHARAHARMFTQTRSQFARRPMRMGPAACCRSSPQTTRRRPLVSPRFRNCGSISCSRHALWHAWPHSAVCLEPTMARMLAILAGLDSSGVARSAVSSGDSCGGRRQVGTASHVNRGRSFVWLHASVCVVRVSLWMPASECAQSIKRDVRWRQFPDRTV